MNYFSVLFSLGSWLRWTNNYQVQGDHSCLGQLLCQHRSSGERRGQYCLQQTLHLRPIRLQTLASTRPPDTCRSSWCRHRGGMKPEIDLSETCVHVKECDAVTENLDVRVGFIKPTDDGNGTFLFHGNGECANYTGPRNANERLIFYYLQSVGHPVHLFIVFIFSKIIINCQRPLTGRYVSLQSLKKWDFLTFFNWSSNCRCSDSAQLAWRQVIVKKKTIGMDDKIVNIYTRDDPSFCSKEYPFAFKNGTMCCETNLELHPSKWTNDWKGLLHYHSQQCYGRTKPSSIHCSDPPCLNRNYKRYTSCKGGSRFKASSFVKIFEFQETVLKDQTRTL